ncbi:PREDICTED: dual specificity protein phosphatase 18-like [Chinchilla lanigera]|uniref:dual specificity protein phosphatase 18-like n=1 Tax=Chinchilla lanigera TaxID=34839 RepID=UPI00069829F4|nr:PREDICTED: dual specificity protein phosphatase 18-like [Chinchilla lanigera]
MQMPIPDAPVAYLSDLFDPIADHIHSVAMKEGHTLLHCAAGMSRSAAPCLAYLMKHQAMSLVDAHTWTKSCQPIILLNDDFSEQFIHYEFQLFGKNTMHMVPFPWKQSRASKRGSLGNSTASLSVSLRAAVSSADLLLALFHDLNLNILLLLIQERTR